MSTPNEMIFAGSSPLLTCTVTLPSSVDINVTVDIQWAGPAEIVNETYLSLTHNQYRSTVVIDKARAGNYTCSATVSSMSQFISGSKELSNSNTVTVGKLWGAKWDKKPCKI